MAVYVQPHEGTPGVRKCSHQKGPGARERTGRALSSALLRGLSSQQLQINACVQDLPVAVVIAAVRRPVSIMHLHLLGNGPIEIAMYSDNRTMKAAAGAVIFVLSVAYAEACSSTYAVAKQSEAFATALAGGCFCYKPLCL